MYFSRWKDISCRLVDWRENLLVAITLGVSMGGAKCFFGQFVCDVASVTCVIGLQCPLMRGRAIHEWTLFTAAPIDAVGRGATIRMVGLFHVGLCV